MYLETIMLSKKCKYAIHALIYLAERYQQGPVHIQEIADRQRIPKKFLEAILLELKNSKILLSKKGKAVAITYTKNLKMLTSWTSSARWTVLLPCCPVFLLIIMSLVKSAAMKKFVAFAIVFLVLGMKPCEFCLKVHLPKLLSAKISSPKSNFY